MCISGKFRAGAGTATIGVLIVILATGPATSAQQLSDEAHVSVLTMLPGKDLYSAWGHTAIRVADPLLGFDNTYNYGTFDFGQPNFYSRFLMGRLDYQLAVDTYERTLRYYNYLERTVIEQHLTLSIDEAQQVYDMLSINYLPENRAYRYNFYFDNCATRPRDVLERALSQTGRMGETLPADDTFRALTVKATENRPWTALGLDFLLSLPSDRNAAGRERLFLPEEVLVALDASLSSDGLRPLVTRKDTVLRFPPVQARIPAFLRPLVLLWLLASVLLFISWYYRTRRSPRWLRWIDAILAALIGFSGCIMLLMWIASDHAVLKPNFNLLWAWPTHLFAAFWLLGEGRSRLGVWYGRLYGLYCLLVLAGWFLLPQALPAALLPVALILGVRLSCRSREAKDRGVSVVSSSSSG